jgi:PDZ domain-containing protein
MSRRTVAGLLALGLMVALGVVAARTPVAYVTFRPGPTMTVLGKYDGKTIVTASGHQEYRDDGALRMVTVYPSGPDDNISLLNMVYGWIDPNIAVLPKDAVYEKDETDDSAHQESAVEMTSSQDNATAAALTALGVGYRTEVEVADVAKDGAAAGVLKKGDVLLAVGGAATPSAKDLIARVRAMRPGTPTELTIRRTGTEQKVTVTTKPAADDPSVSRIGVGIKEDFVFPFKVKIRLPGTIGGPSAGMMFALAIYDVLTPGSLTGGKAIAGSGEIAPDGTVGPIGGIGQKLPAAQRDGAKLFLVAADNCAEALGSHYDPGKMRLVKVEKLADAIKDVEAWRQDPKADLPRCTR